MHFRPPASAIHFEFQQMGHALVTAGQDMTILLMGVVSRICGRGDVLPWAPLPVWCRYLFLAGAGVVVLVAVVVVIVVSNDLTAHHHKKGRPT